MKWYWEIYLANKVAHQWCGFRGGHSGNKPMVSYGMSMSNENQNDLKELVKMIKILTKSVKWKMWYSF